MDNKYHALESNKQIDAIIGKLSFNEKQLGNKILSFISNEGYLGYSKIINNPSLIFNNKDFANRNVITFLYELGNIQLSEKDNSTTHIENTISNKKKDVLGVIDASN